MLLRLMIGLPALLLPGVASAFTIAPPGGAGGGAGGLMIYLAQIAPNLQWIFIAVLFLFLFLYAATMIVLSSQDNAMTEAKNSYIYAIFGMITVSVAGLIAGAVAPGKGTLLATGTLVKPIGNIYAYIMGIASVGLLANITIQGMRLVSSAGEQESIDKARKRLITSIIGVGVIFLTKAIVTASTSTTISVLSVEVAGIANFAISFVGILAVGAIIVGGFLLVISFQESLKEKAKTMIKTSIVALVVVLLSYTLVAMFIAPS